MVDISSLIFSEAKPWTASLLDSDSEGNSSDSDNESDSDVCSSEDEEIYIDKPKSSFSNLMLKDFKCKQILVTQR